MSLGKAGGGHRCLLLIGRNFISPVACRLYDPFMIHHNFWSKAKVFPLKDFIYFQREGKGGKKGEREKHQRVVASHVPPTGDLACNPGMCPDWESNGWSFASEACTQSTEPHQPGSKGLYWRKLLYSGIVERLNLGSQKTQGISPPAYKGGT